MVRKHADWVFKYVKDACDARDITLERADQMAGSPMITSRIFEAVRSADVCVGDLSGLNANVFYELGVRHSLAKPVVHIAAEGTALPFDNAQHDTIFFDLSAIDSMESLTKQLGRQFDEILRSDYVVSNPFTAALGAIELAQSGDPRDQVFARFEERLAAVERSTAFNPPQRAIATLDDVLEVLRSSAARKAMITIDPELMRHVVKGIPPWHSDQAQELLWAINGTAPLTNGPELQKIVEEKFSGLIPF